MPVHGAGWLGFVTPHSASCRLVLRAERFSACPNATPTTTPIAAEGLSAAAAHDLYHIATNFELSVSKGERGVTKPSQPAPWTGKADAARA